LIRRATCPASIGSPDVFGGVLLVKAWGRIGTEGRSVAEFYDTAALAADAL
jgi:predicted DNA-binding WGR domain protein